METVVILIVVGIYAALIAKGIGSIRKDIAEIKEMINKLKDK